MLRMKCTECNIVISSPFLAELSSIECSQCKNNVTVKDVFVTTKGLTIYRDDLLNQVFRYQKMLREVEKEKNSIKSDDKNLATSKKGLYQLEEIIKELLDGARKNFRIEMPDDSIVEIELNNTSCTSKLVNLSSEGASIKLENVDDLSEKRNKINLQIPLPGISAPLSVKAKIVWSKKMTGDKNKHTLLGLKFVDIDENARSAIWNFIINTASVPLSHD